MSPSNPSPVRVFSRQYCGECLAVHWVEEVTRTRFVCHGLYFVPQDTDSHYTRWRNGTIELCEKFTNAPCITDWIFAEQIEEREEVDQDW